MVVLTNFERFPEQWESASGLKGTAIVAQSVWEFFRFAPRSTLIIVNCNVPLTLKLSALFWLLPYLRKPILCNDIVLRRPLNCRSRITARIKRLLLGRIDHFCHYFRDRSGYEKYFGIGPEASVPLTSQLMFRIRAQWEFGARNVVRGNNLWVIFNYAL